MNKLLLILALFALPSIGIEQNTTNSALLSEFINNTDEEIVIGKYGAFNDIQIVTFALESNQPLAPRAVKPVSSNGLFRISLKPRTRNLLLGLEIPSREVGNFKNLCLSEIILLDGINKNSRMIFSFCRMGELMVAELCHVPLRNLFISQEQVTVANRWIPHILDQKILNNAHYSIRVDYADTKKLFNIHFDNIPAPSTRLASFSKAFIGEFQPGTITDGRVKASICFEHLVTLEFLKKFTTLLKEEIKNGLIEQSEAQPLSLVFYTDITQDQLKKIIDKVNRVVSKTTD